MELTKEQLEQLQKDLAQAKSYSGLMDKNRAIGTPQGFRTEQLRQSEMTKHPSYDIICVPKK